MRDLTHPIIFATHRVQLGLNGDGKRRIRYEATGGFRRSDYGMTAERGIIGDEVALQVVIEAVDQR
jgi:polyisoprenoid-binding protein YceI